MGQGRSAQARSQISHAADATDLQPHVTGSNGLTGGAHAHGIGPQSLEHADLRRGLILGACGLEIHPLFQRKAQLLGGSQSPIPQAGAVDLCHVREPGSQLLQVLAQQR